MISRMKNLFKKHSHYAIFFCTLLIYNQLQGQIAGEMSVGVRAGMEGAPMGLTYHYVLTHHSSVEAHIGYSPKQGRAIEEGFYRGNLMMGLVYQPYIVTGDRDVATCLYASIGARLRLHNYRLRNPPSINYHKFHSPVTPDFILGAGFLLELHESIEAFVQLDGVSFDSYAYGREFGVESTLGLRFRIN